MLCTGSVQGHNAMAPIRIVIQIWRHRVMVGGVIRRDLRTRYAGSALGVVWMLLHPLVHLAVYLVVFSWILQVKFPETGGSGGFALYLLAGLLPWLAFQEGVMRATTAVVDHASVVKGMRFPAAVLVVGSVVASVVNLLVGLGVFLVALLVIDRFSWMTLPFLPVLLVLQSSLALGLGLVAASFYTFLRDTMQVLQIGLMIWFYLTPIVYPPSYVPERLSFLYSWNPLTPLVSGYRAVLLNGMSPSFSEIAPLLMWAAAAWIVGGILFGKLEPGFADVL